MKLNMLLDFNEAKYKKKIHGESTWKTLTI